MYMNHKNTKNPADKYFGIFGPPNSPLPNTDRNLLRKTKVKHKTHAIVNIPTENARSPAKTLNGNPFNEIKFKFEKNKKEY